MYGERRCVVTAHFVVVFKEVAGTTCKGLGKTEEIGETCIRVFELLMFATGCGKVLPTPTSCQAPFNDSESTGVDLTWTVR